MKRYIKASVEDYSDMSREDLYKAAKKQHLISTNADKWMYDRDLLQYAVMYNVKLNKIRMRDGKRLLKPEELNSLFIGSVQTFKSLLKEFWPKEAKKNPRIYLDDYNKMDGPGAGAGYEVDFTNGDYQDKDPNGYISYFDMLGQYVTSESAWEM